MKHKDSLLHVLFTAGLTLVLLGCVVARTVFPTVILPRWNIPNLVALSAAVLTLEHSLAPGARRNYLLALVFAALSCGVLPWIAGLGNIFWGLSGGLVFTATAWLYDAMIQRLSTGPAAKAAPVMGALGLYLAAQCFQNILL